MLAATFETGLCAAPASAAEALPAALAGVELVPVELVPAALVPVALVAALLVVAPPDAALLGAGAGLLWLVDVELLLPPQPASNTPASSATSGHLVSWLVI
jgi:hypothetical protein